VRSVASTAHEAQTPIPKSASRARAPISAKLRFSVLMRDGFRCRYCGRTAGEPEVVLHVDHVVPLSAGGLTMENNLVASCAECNLGKSTRTVESAWHRRGWMQQRTDALSSCAGADSALCCATAPIPVWSGNIVRHRLSRGGNRQLNSALHRIAITQLRCPSLGQAYVAKRLAAGDTKTEAIRALRRRLSDEVYRRLQADEAARAASGSVMRVAA